MNNKLENNKKVAKLLVLFQHLVWGADEHHGKLQLRKVGCLLATINTIRESEYVRSVTSQPTVQFMYDDKMLMEFNFYNSRTNKHCGL
jgi:hypothetical protein